VLGGEADQRLSVAAARGERRENVVGGFELERQPSPLALRELAGDRLDRTVVGHGGAHHEHIGGIELRSHASASSPPLVTST
jgi:hypothetical protein